MPLRHRFQSKSRSFPEQRQPSFVAVLFEADFQGVVAVGELNFPGRMPDRLLRVGREQLLAVETECHFAGRKQMQAVGARLNREQAASPHSRKAARIEPWIGRSLAPDKAELLVDALKWLAAGRRELSDQSGTVLREFVV